MSGFHDNDPRLQPDDYPPDDDDCPNCGGEGYVYSCQDEIGCIDPEGGCDLCMRRCDWCNPRPRRAVDARAPLRRTYPIADDDTGGGD